MPVSLDDLARRLGRPQPEPRAHQLLDAGIELRVRSDGPGDLADGDHLARPAQPLPAAVQLEGPDRELVAEAGRLGMNAVAASDDDGVAVLQRQALRHGHQPLQEVEQDIGGRPQLERETRVQHVG
jgi:hypothetical protein